ncbi:uvrB uvrC motif-containing [Chlorella sorokiniana]|uniref:UvrB uvrC motif-containing n=1 Tax=Chlorella sorokiniana TaxID=3076 RepID=A0A2P6TZ62_CHLSO|nr:uvrB uvrC motif-containing [Chlorella sorokiniana]|eukprot:PRW59357.1 uvrB uvrC motif-containing [Chlorella sorokiniana]
MAARALASHRAPAPSRPDPALLRRRSPAAAPVSRGARQPTAASSCGSGAHPSEQQQELQETLQSLHDRIESYKAQLLVYVHHEDFGRAAAARDALMPLQLRARQLQLAAERHRNGAVLHAIGTVIRHRRYGYRGVIAGHDPRCQAEEAWIQQMRVDMLPGGREQPFYSVLVDERDRPGGQTTYVAQENIICVRKPNEVEHPLIPQLFVGFSPEEAAYIPGPSLRARYPAEF